MAGVLRYFKVYFFGHLFFCCSIYRGSQQRDSQNTKLEDVAGSEEALDFMKTFAGRRVLSGSSEATPQKKF